MTNTPSTISMTNTVTIPYSITSNTIYAGTAQPGPGGLTTIGAKYSTYAVPKFNLNQDSDGTWHIIVNTKNKKFARSVLQALLNDCDDLELEESIEVTKQISKVI